MNNAESGSAPVLFLSIVDEDTPSNNPVVGQSPTVAIRRFSDGKWWDFVSSQWDTFGDYTEIGGSNKQELSDYGDGGYGYVWDQAAADGSAVRQYDMIYEVAAGDYQGQPHEVWSFDEAPPTVAEFLAGFDAEYNPGVGPWSGSLGDGSVNVPLSVADDQGDPVVGARATVIGMAGQTSISTGAFPHEWALDAGGTYEISLQAPVGYSSRTPYELILDDDGAVVSPAGGVLVVDVVQIPVAPGGEYCSVYVRAEDQEGMAQVGAFEVTAVHSPSSRGDDEDPVVVVYGPEEADLVDGVATLMVLREAVVSFRLVCGTEEVRFPRVTIPDEASANVNTLE